MVVSKKKTKKQSNISRKLIPEKYKENWNKDFEELTSEERDKLTQKYLDGVKRRRMGIADKQPPKPKFLTQRDKIAKFESEAREKGRIEREEREKVESEAKEKDDKKKEKLLTERREEWEKSKLIALSPLENFQLENAQLKIELAKRDIVALQGRLDNLTKIQESLASQIGEKYGINPEDYGMDLNNGLWWRNSAIQFPYNEKNILDAAEKERGSEEDSQKETNEV